MADSYWNLPGSDEKCATNKRAPIRDEDSITWTSEGTRDTLPQWQSKLKPEPKAFRPKVEAWSMNFSSGRKNVRTKPTITTGGGQLWQRLRDAAFSRFLLIIITRNSFVSQPFSPHLNCFSSKISHQFQRHYHSADKFCTFLTTIDELPLRTSRNESTKTSPDPEIFHYHTADLNTTFVIIFSSSTRNSDLALDAFTTFIQLVLPSFILANLHRVVGIRITCTYIFHDSNEHTLGF